MPWDWLLQLVAGSHGSTADSIRRLPPLQKPPETTIAADAAAGGHSREPEYCQRMAFKLTPTYNSKLQARVRWLKVLRAAQQPVGGGWALNFDAEYMTPRRLRQLADRIDDIFLDGSFAQVCSPCYAVQEARLTPSEAGDCDAKAVCHATAGFEPSSNTIMFYRPAWQHQPSLRMPVQADGVYCSNKLEWLAHTMAHEQVHCIVHHACPQTSRMQAYVANHGHGPVFLQLNKAIFAHHTARYRAGWSRLHPRLRIEPLKVTHSLKHQQQQEGQQLRSVDSCSDEEQEWP